MLWTTKAEVHGFISQPIMAYVSHLTWQLLVATIAVASGTPVDSSVHIGMQLIQQFVGKCGYRCLHRSCNTAHTDVQCIMVCKT